jgi:Raf kinase inhibitor-like YbhB/YbcL family protein
MKIKSPAFQDKGTLPRKYACDGDGISPPLQSEGVPDEAVTLTLILDDPDAPRGAFTHWLVHDLPGTATGLPEDVPRRQALEGGGLQGENSTGGIGYAPPCPGRGTHRYVFKLYALDSDLGLDPGVNQDELMDAMEGHILDEAQLVVSYKRESR